MRKMRNEKCLLNLVTEALVASLTTGWLEQWGHKAKWDGLRGECEARKWRGAQTILQWN